MKTCPYCAEEIQEGALKCKHCGEWLNKEPKSKLIDESKLLFNKASSFFKDKQQDYLKKRYAHLYYPSDDNPFELENLKFYPKYFTHAEKRVDYSEVASIQYIAREERTNGVFSTKERFLWIFLDIESNFPLENRETDRLIELSKSRTLGLGSSKKTLEKMDFIQGYLKKVTFTTRLSKYQNELSKNGFFFYPHKMRIFKNGDIEKKGKIKDNLVSAYKDKRIQYGSESSSLFGKYRYSTPNTLYIHPPKSNSISNLFKGNTTIEVLYDQDVFDHMLDMIIRQV